MPPGSSASAPIKVNNNEASVGSKQNQGKAAGVRHTGRSSRSKVRGEEKIGRRGKDDQSKHAEKQDGESIDGDQDTESESLDKFEDAWLYDVAVKEKNEFPGENAMVSVHGDGVAHENKKNVVDNSTPVVDYVVGQSPSEFKDIANSGSLSSPNSYGSAVQELEVTTAVEELEVATSLEKHVWTQTVSSRTESVNKGNRTPGEADEIEVSEGSSTEVNDSIEKMVREGDFTNDRKIPQTDEQSRESTNNSKNERNDKGNSEHDLLKNTSIKDTQTPIRSDNKHLGLNKSEDIMEEATERRIQTESSLQHPWKSRSDGKAAEAETAKQSNSNLTKASTEVTDRNNVTVGTCKLSNARRVKERKNLEDHENKGVEKITLVSQHLNAKPNTACSDSKCVTENTNGNDEGSEGKSDLATKTAKSKVSDCEENDRESPFTQNESKSKGITEIRPPRSDRNDSNATGRLPTSGDVPVNSEMRSMSSVSNKTEKSKLTTSNKSNLASLATSKVNCTSQEETSGATSGLVQSNAAKGTSRASTTNMPNTDNEDMENQTITEADKNGSAAKVHKESGDTVVIDTLGNKHDRHVNARTHLKDKKEQEKKSPATPSVNSQTEYNEASNLVEKAGAHPSKWGTDENDPTRIPLRFDQNGQEDMSISEGSSVMSSEVVESRTDGMINATEAVVCNSEKFSAVGEPKHTSEDLPNKEQSLNERKTFNKSQLHGVEAATSSSIANGKNDGPIEKLDMSKTTTVVRDKHANVLTDSSEGRQREAMTDEKEAVALRCWTIVEVQDSRISLKLVSSQRRTTFADAINPEKAKGGSGDNAMMLDQATSGCLDGKNCGEEEADGKIPEGGSNAEEPDLDDADGVISERSRKIFNSDSHRNCAVNEVKDGGSQSTGQDRADESNPTKGRYNRGPRSGSPTGDHRVNNSNKGGSSSSHAASSENKEDLNRSKKTDPNAGVGLNRIRIAPVMEHRPPGSVGSHVVNRLLVQYGLIDPTDNDDSVETKKVDDKQAVKFGAVQSRESKDGKGLKVSSVQRDRNSNRPSTRGRAGKQDQLIHDYQLPEKQEYRKGRPPRIPVLSPMLIGDADSQSLPEDFQYLPLECKVEILDRSSGTVLSGAEAVAMKELPDLLQRRASFEPILPKEMGVVEAGPCALREARSSTRTYVSGTVRRQNRTAIPLADGEYVRVTKGPDKGTTGILENVLVGGWSEISVLYPARGPKILVNSDFLTVYSPKVDSRRSQKKRSSKRRKLSEDDVRSVFLNSIHEQFEDSKLAVMNSQNDVLPEEGNDQISGESDPSLQQRAILKRLELEELQESEERACAYADSAFIV